MIEYFFSQKCEKEEQQKLMNRTLLGGCQNVIQKYLNSMAMVKEVANHELKRNAVKEIMNKS